MNHFSSSLMIPCIIPLFQYDLLRTVGSTQSCSISQPSEFKYASDGGFSEE